MTRATGESNEKCQSVKKNFSKKDIEREWQKFINNSCKNGKQDKEKQGRECDTRIEKEKLTEEITLNRVSETKCDESLSCMSSGGKIRLLNELVDIFLTAMWLPHSQLWATAEDAASLT